MSNNVKYWIFHVCDSDFVYWQRACKKKKYIFVTSSRPRLWITFTLGVFFKSHTHHIHMYLYDIRLSAFVRRPVFRTTPSCPSRRLHTRTRTSRNILYTMYVRMRQVYCLSRWRLFDGTPSMGEGDTSPSMVVCKIINRLGARTLARRLRWRDSFVRIVLFCLFWGNFYTFRPFLVAPPVFGDRDEIVH